MSINLRYLATLFAINLLLTTTGCVIAPRDSNQNRSSAGNYNNTNTSSSTLEILGLADKNTRYANNELRNRGYRQLNNIVSGDSKDSLWYNWKENRCYRVQSSGGVVSKVRVANLKQCVEEDNRNKGQSSDRNDNNGSGKNVAPPQTAKAACIKRFGTYNYQKIKTISPLKPGWWEIIVQGKNGRHVACTVNGSGNINGWVEM